MATQARLTKAFTPSHETPTVLFSTRVLQSFRAHPSRQSAYRLITGTAVVSVGVGDTEYTIAAGIPKHAMVKGVAVEEIQSGGTGNLLFQTDVGGTSTDYVAVGGVGWTAKSYENEQDPGSIAVTRASEATSPSKVRVDVWWEEFGRPGVVGSDED